MRRIVLFLLGLAFVAGAEEEPKEKPEAETAKPKVYELGDKVELGKLREPAAEREVDLAAALKDAKKGIVLVWYSPYCPYCFKPDKLEGLTKIVEAYKDKGWTFYGVVSDTNVDKRLGGTAEAYAKIAKEQKIPFPLLLDLDQKVARAFQAKRTPTFAVITKDGKLGYQGAPWQLRYETPFVSNYLKAVTEDKAPPKHDAAAMAAWG